VTLHEVEIIDFGWAAIVPGFGFLADEFTEPYVRTFTIAAGQNEVAFNDRIRIPLRPFAGVMGVAPATDSMLSTIPPRANGGNMDNRHLTAGTAVQGDGEISGTAIESPMRIVYELNLVRGAGAPIAEPQYENDLTYGVTAFATTIDEAARKASRYMIDYLTSEHGLSRPDAYLLASFAADLKIAEVVDVPHVLVAMHIDKNVLGTAGRLRFADRYAR
jgi:acetamidase/formamidase